MADDVVVALDVGGTGITCALVDTAGQARHSKRHATGRERGPAAVVGTIMEITEGPARTAERAAPRDRRTFQREPVLLPATLGDEAGCLGAGLIARDVLNRVAE